MEKQKLNKWDIQNIAWNLFYFYPDASTDCAPDERMYNCARAILIAQQEGCGDCMLVDDFLEAVEAGGFNSYDGDGYFCDEDGNDLGGVWGVGTIPESAKFVMWFNK